MCGAKVEGPPVVVVEPCGSSTLCNDTEEFLQGGLGEGQVLMRAARDEEAEWKLQRRTEAQAAGSPPS